MLPRGERGKQNSNTKIQSCKAKDPWCLTLGVPTSAIGALLFDSSEHLWHLQLCICMCQDWLWLTVKPVWDLETNIPLPKSTGQYFWEYALWKKKKKKEDLRKYEYKTGGQQQLSFLLNREAPGDLKTVKNCREWGFLDRAFQAAGSSSLLWGQVCALWRNFFPSRPGSGCSAHI